MASLWSERFQPITEAELVVHKNKVQEVRDFFRTASKRILILSGPPGCGKASVLKCVLNDLNFELIEWSPA